MKVTAYDPKKDKEVMVGVYATASGIFTKTVSARHFMRKYNGYAIQTSVIEYLTSINCRTVRIKTNKESYIASFKRWKRDGIYKDYGHGEQCFYSIKFMTKE